jgi:hypothetical protein
MAVSNSNMSFRRQRAHELRQMADLLGRQLDGIDTFPIYNAVSKLVDPNFIPKLIDGSTDENIWGYEIENFHLPVETLRHAYPNDIKKGQIVLNMKLRGKIGNWNSFNDPFIELAFNVLIRGIGSLKTYHFGFHVDKHITNHSTEPHPIYHLQFDFNPTSTTQPNIGDLFIIDTPRIMHKPLEFILGISFLTSNFYPKGFKGLCESREFQNLMETYQYSVWRPYFHTLASKWKPLEGNNIIWNPITDICPILV